MPATHEVVNQPPPLVDDDPFAADLALREAVVREGGEWGLPSISAFARIVGSARVRGLGHDANRFAPQLRSHDRFGHRIDEVEFHPAWHELMAVGMANAVHALPWRDPRPGAQVVRAAMFALLNHAENGVCCPLTMTFAAAPALRLEPELAAEWLPRTTALEYDPRLVDPATKSACTVGMAMTEKQGGSDVRANRTTAVDRADGWWRLHGHKWFCSAPMCDAFLTLAQVEGSGLSCFLVPRVLPDGTRNAFAIQRLKDKLGNRSNASSEIEYDGTLARPVGAPGRGVATIMEMVQHTRLDCAIGSAAIMRAALAQAIHHAHHRATFGRRLIEHPAMIAVLADLQLESEGATALVLRLARAFDKAGAGDEWEAAFVRIATPLAKYWICKRCPAVVAEALECLGGNGYVEESPLPRLYREAPLSSIWEGSGNVMCLDLLRTLARHPEAKAALFCELDLASSADRRFATVLDDLVCDVDHLELLERDERERRIRGIAERLAMTLVASLLLRAAPVEVGEGYLLARILAPGSALGAIAPDVDASSLVARALPT